MKSIYARDNRYDRLRVLLIEARKGQELTQVELARKLRQLQSFVSNYERGARTLDVIEYLDICEALGQDPLKLLKQLAR